LPMCTTSSPLNCVLMILTDLLLAHSLTDPNALMDPAENHHPPRGMPHWPPAMA
jgi:hypothetical protein